MYHQHQRRWQVCNDGGNCVIYQKFHLHQAVNVFVFFAVKFVSLRKTPEAIQRSPDFGTCWLHYLASDVVWQNFEQQLYVPSYYP